MFYKGTQLAGEKKINPEEPKIRHSSKVTKL